MTATSGKVDSNAQPFRHLANLGVAAVRIKGAGMWALAEMPHRLRDNIIRALGFQRIRSTRITGVHGFVVTPGDP
jgi:hypothetical protein